ncbi:MAG: HAMP domain-containing sensor histidine kinase [Prevotellaceae bacterium]|nr:HAMP domain-containing histidine kinase [Prevotella sp.]MDD7530407.1 HAMP domain-containing sensor histidine kinase [Prevotellaceae bacterium]MDY2633561.1 HAMP domain-containing sensor histidine kinase [Prevotella sp.]
MAWLNQIRQVKILLITLAFLTAMVSLVVSRILVRDLYEEERKKMEIWAEAIRSFNMADENTDIGLVLKVIDENHTIPVVVMDNKGEAVTFRNINVEGNNAEDSLNYIARRGNEMKKAGNFIRIMIGDDDRHPDYQYVCYDDSLILKRLSMWPYVQLSMVLVFVLVAIIALLTSKRAEQNKVWVGLSKETAHQLGTPISSLMAWIEILKETYPSDTLLPEMDKDVKRLQLIADRFSKIGSLPELSAEPVNGIVDRVADYMRRRTSKKVSILTHLSDDDLLVNVNASLFEWVIENLCKNAVDAIEGEGKVTISVGQIEGKVVIDVSDTGKGIRKKDLNNVFRPGFTTKKRGWGLGLSLARRIVEEYHHGKIKVKWSEPGMGTTFRIELKSVRKIS